jgi:hypothetical protein
VNTLYAFKESLGLYKVLEEQEHEPEDEFLRSYLKALNLEGAK